MIRRILNPLSAFLLRPADYCSHLQIIFAYILSDGVLAWLPVWCKVSLPLTVSYVNKIWIGFTFMVLDYPGSISDHLLMCTEEEIMIKISQENDCCKLANENFGYYCNRLICCQCTVTST